MGRGCSQEFSSSLGSWTQCSHLSFSVSGTISHPEILHLFLSFFMSYLLSHLIPVSLACHPGGTWGLLLSLRGCFVSIVQYLDEFLVYLWRSWKPPRLTPLPFFSTSFYVLLYYIKLCRILYKISCAFKKQHNIFVNSTVFRDRLISIQLCHNNGIDVRSSVIYYELCGFHLICEISTIIYSVYEFPFYRLPSQLISKESACNAGDPGSVRGLQRSPGEGNGNPLQYSYVENSMDRRA